MFRVIGLLFLVVLAGCAPRGRLAWLPAPDPAAREVFVATSRAPDPQLSYGFGRSMQLHRAEIAVATPPDRQPGQIDYPKQDRPADPARQFMVSQADLEVDQARFRADLHQALARNHGEAVVYVHGFNTDFAEGVYRMAQLGRDFDLPGVLVHYSWPSRAHVLGYAYDRDSVLFARDGLEELLRDLEAAGAKRILLLAHSLGSQLVMEVLRQDARSDKTLFQHISGVVLISPDIAVDVFRTQAAAVGTLPQPFVIFTSQRDRALMLSARLTGQRDRLGNLEDVERVAQYRVTLIDTGAFSTGTGHFNVGDSPALIRLLDRAGEVAKVLEGEQRGKTGLASGVILTVENATQIVLSPLTTVGGG